MFKKNIYKIVVLCLVTLGIVSFSGCNIIQTKNPSVSEIVTNIKSATDLSTMQQGDKSKLRKLYSISNKNLEEFDLYAPKTNMEANEIVILKVKNQDDIDGLKENIEKRIERQAESFKSYRPEQYELLESHIFIVKGKYIISVVSKDADKIKKAVDDSFKASSKK